MRVAAVALLAAVTVLALASSARAQVFFAPGQIEIPGSGTSGEADPYPSTLTVAGMTGAITNATVTLNGFRHTFPADVEALLVGPSGQSTVLMADAGGSNDVSGLTLTFADAASVDLPTPLVSGTFRPTPLGSFTGPPPAPAAGHGVALSAFNGTVPNGTWRLFVYDDANGDTGAITGGWSLDVTTNGPAVTSFTPTTAPPGTTVVITGGNLTGASAVRFGGQPAASFNVVSPTQITAVVPGDAVSGPVSVTTPNGVASSVATFSVSPPPAVTSLSPDEGRVGDTVTITGTNLAGATEVRFGSIPVASFSVASPTSITATVPAGAGAGTISVQGPGGTGSSPQPFVVEHRRSTSLNVSRRRARGRVNVRDGFSKCAARVPISLQRRVRGGWRRVGRDVTSQSGRYRVRGRNRRGRYRAVARKTTLESGDVCNRDKSRSDRIRRRARRRR